MNTAYQIYQAEHSKSRVEQREEARRNGELALALSRLLRRRRPASGPAAPPRRGSLETCGSCG